MSDSIEDLSPVNNDIFSFPTDWTVKPKQKRDVAISASVEPGTVHYIHFFRDPVDTITIQITDLHTKLYPFLIYFADKVGRLKTFWLPDYSTRFLISQIDPSRFFIDIVKQADIYLHGKERIYIVLKNGDVITRKINSYEQMSDATRFFFSTQLPIFDQSDVDIFTLIFYVRFDMDAVDIEYLSGAAARTTVSFVELLMEYDTWV